MTIRRFEDIEAWQEARRLVNLVYEAINGNQNFQKDYRLVNQIQGAAVSAMSNIAGKKAKHSVMELEGLGADIWKGVDAQEYVLKERNSWD